MSYSSTQNLKNAITESISDLDTRVDTLTIDLESVYVSTQDNKNLITALSTNVGTNTTNIGTLTTNLSSLTTTVGTNTTDLSSLTDNLQSLAIDVSGNTVAIASINEYQSMNIPKQFAIVDTSGNFNLDTLNLSLSFNVIKVTGEVNSFIYLPLLSPSSYYYITVVNRIANGSDLRVLATDPDVLIANNGTPAEILLIQNTSAMFIASLDGWLVIQ